MTPPKLYCALLLSLCTLAVSCRSLQSFPDEIELRVATFNIRYGTAKDGDNAWPHRRDAVSTTIRDLRLDVIGVQEALRFQLDALLEDLPQMRAIGQGRDGGQDGEHTAILFDTRRFEVVEHGEFWLSETPDVVASVGWDAALTRCVTWVGLRERANGVHIMVWNAHFDHRGRKARLESAKLLRDKLLAQRVDQSLWSNILLGDFNAGEDSAPIATLLISGNLIDAWKLRHPNTPPEQAGTFGGFRGRRDSERIDYIFAERGIGILDAGIERRQFDGRDPSDHYPVWAVLKVGRGYDPIAPVF